MWMYSWVGWLIFIGIQVAMILSAFRIRQGFNENSNTPFAMVIFVISLALLCRLV